MCGRAVIAYSWDQITAELMLKLAPPIGVPTPNYNTPPGTQVPAIWRATPDHAEIGSLRWGYHIPDLPKPVINARAETAADKRMHAAALRTRRCLVPVSGYYEWQRRAGAGKQAWYFTRERQRPLLLAGLRTVVRGEHSFVILTAPPVEPKTAAVHDRVPCAIHGHDAERWLDPACTDPAEALAMARAFGDPEISQIDAWPVSSRVNATRNSGPELIEPITPDVGLFD